MADTIPEMLQRLTGQEAAEQQQAAGQLGSLAYRLAHDSPADVPRLEPAVLPLTVLLTSDSADLQLVAAGSSPTCARPRPRWRPPWAAAARRALWCSCCTIPRAAMHRRWQLLLWAR